MAYPLNQDVKKPYSLAFVDGYLQIQNGIEGTYNFLGSTVAIVQGCNSVDTCNSELKRFVPDTLKIWGKKVDCCQYQLDTVSLDPKNFGYDTSEELAQAIATLLLTDVQSLIQNNFFGGEILATEQKTGYTLDGKDIYKTAIRISGFVNGSGVTHNLDIENYVTMEGMAWVSGDASDKRQLNALDEAIAGQQFYYGALQVDTIDEIITDLPGGLFNELLLVIEYTKND